MICFIQKPCMRIELRCDMPRYVCPEPYAIYAHSITGVDLAKATLITCKLNGSSPAPISI